MVEEKKEPERRESEHHEKKKEWYKSPYAIGGFIIAGILLVFVIWPLIQNLFAGSAATTVTPPELSPSQAGGGSGGGEAVSPSEPSGLSAFKKSLENLQAELGMLRSNETKMSHRYLSQISSLKNEISKLESGTRNAPHPHPKAHPIGPIFRKIEPKEIEKTVQKHLETVHSPVHSFIQESYIGNAPVFRRELLPYEEKPIVHPIGPVFRKLETKPKPAVEPVRSPIRFSMPQSFAGPSPIFQRFFTPNTIRGKEK